MACLPMSILEKAGKNIIALRNEEPYPNNGYNSSKPVSAFTSSELGELLPKGCFTYQFESWHTAQFDEMRNIKIFPGAETEANARAKLLIHLLENKII